MNDNEFELNGKSYIAVDDNDSPCIGCALHHKDECGESYYHVVPQCDGNGRPDHRNVIFVEKQQ